MNFHVFSTYFDLKGPVLRGGTIDEQKKEKLFEALGFFEAMLKGRTWAAVNNFTIADLALTVTVAQIEMFEIDLEPYTRVRTWLQRCKDHLRSHGYDVSTFSDAFQTIILSLSHLQEIQQGGLELAKFFREKLSP